jgi:hypothetical protein
MARITVKGIPHDVEVKPQTPLLPVLREQLGLPGTVTQKAGPALDAAPAGQAERDFSGMLHG